MQVAIRVDGGADIGWGHVMRCLTLARALQRYAINPIFLCRQPTWALVKRYWPAAECYTIPTTLCPRQDAKYCQAVLERKRKFVHAVIVDHYGLGVEWERHWLGISSIVAIDDIKRPHQCDSIIDTNFSISKINPYKNKIPKHCVSLLGPAYALLRQEFAKIHLHRPDISRQQVKRLFLCFGGADLCGVTEWALKALGSDYSGLAVDIVVGSSHAYIDSLHALCDHHPTWHLYIGHTRPEILMAKADLAIGAGGTMTWERCALGLPSIVISIANNQVETCLAMAEAKWILYLGPHDRVQPHQLRDAIAELTADQARRRHMMQACRKLVDGRGAERIVRTIRQLCD